MNILQVRSKKISPEFWQLTKYDDMRLRIIWHGMKQRCYSKKSASYKYYGGKGITIFLKWRINYNNFRSWAEQSGYRPNMTIDRIDPSKNYCPENCQWLTRSDNAIKGSKIINKKHVIVKKDGSIDWPKKRKTCKMQLQNERLVKQKEKIVNKIIEHSINYLFMEEMTFDIKTLDKITSDVRNDYLNEK